MAAALRILRAGVPESCQKVFAQTAFWAWRGGVGNGRKRQSSEGRGGVGLGGQKPEVEKETLADNECQWSVIQPGER